jgi:hypothetical protein
VKYTDPDGRYVEITKTGNDITITLPVYFKNGTKEERTEFINAVQDAWSGKFGDYNVTLKVEHRLHGGDQTNAISWEDYSYKDGVVGATTPDDKSVTFYRNDGSKPPPLVGLGDLKKLPSQVGDFNQDEIYAHETGHLMHLDHVGNDKRNVMAPRAVAWWDDFNVTKDNIDALLKANDIE